MVMNREPTLHRPSMTGFWVVPQDTKTFKISLAVTKPLNADFDGDETNCHVSSSKSHGDNRSKRINGDTLSHTIIKHQKMVCQ